MLLEDRNVESAQQLGQSHLSHVARIAKMRADAEAAYRSGVESHGLSDSELQQQEDEARRKEEMELKMRKKRARALAESLATPRLTTALAWTLSARATMTTTTTTATATTAATRRLMKSMLILIRSWPQVPRECSGIHSCTTRCLVVRWRCGSRRSCCRRRMAASSTSSRRECVSPTPSTTRH